VARVQRRVTIKRDVCAWVLAGLLLASPCTARAEDVASTPFVGVRVIVRSLAGPPRETIHIAEIDLKEPNLRFVTTEGNGDKPRETNTESTLEFVKRKQAQLGINANFFILDHKPDTDVRGLAVSNGQIVSPWEDHEAALNISAKNEARIIHRATEDFKGTATEPKVDLYNAVCGGKMLVEDGENVATESGKSGGERHPRTCVGLKPGNIMLWVIVDGRHPDHSEGMNYGELADLMLSLGARDAMELDGGGSATFVVANPSPTVLNVPMTTAVPAGIKIPPPGIQRRNGNNLALYALSPTGDTDGDGKLDIAEGMGDTDGDGLMDYLDAK